MVNKYGCTPLHYAAQYGCVRIVEILLQAGADKNAANEHGWTPLHYAARYGREAIIQKFIKAGADKNALTNEGLTPLQSAWDAPNINSNVIYLLAI